MTTDTIHAPTGAVLQTLAARLIARRLDWTWVMVEAGFTAAVDDERQRTAGALVSRDGGSTAVWLSGEHDLASSVLLTTALAEAFAEDADVVIDMTYLTFMDVTTLSLLLRGRDFLGARGRRFSVRAAPRCARILLELSELGAVMESDPEAPGGPRQDRPVANALETWVTVLPAERAPPLARPPTDLEADPNVARPMSAP